MKKLSILIPQYNEDEKIVCRLLDSIKIQQRVNLDDIEVLILNDGNKDTIISDDVLNSYPFDVKYFIGDHKGVSASRNELLRQASGEYVAFCDADDAYNGLFALFVVFREMNIGFDALIGNFIQETKMPNGDWVMMDMPTNFNFVHGKFWKRKFLIDNDIQCREDAPIHEDAPLMALTRAYTQNIKYCPTPIYAWLWREDSVCRRDELYLQKTMKHLLMNQSWVIEKLIKRGRIDIVRETSWSIINDVYYALNEKKWLDTANKELRDEAEGYFKFFYNTYKRYANELTQTQKDQITAAQKQMSVQRGILFEDVTFASWISHIEKDVTPISFELKHNN